MTHTAAQAVYLVKIQINCDGYEKHVATTATASSKEDAGVIAVNGEAHNELTLNDEGWYIENDDSFAYFIKSVTKLTAQEAAVFHKFNI